MKNISFRLLCIGGLAYPFVAYMYMKLLLKLSIVETPWMFVALMSLLVVYIGSVIGIAVISDSTRRIPWMVIFSALVPLLLPAIARWSIDSVSVLIGPTNFPYEMQVDSPQFWSFMFRTAINYTVYGVHLGIIMGVMFGRLKTMPNPETKGNLTT